MANLRAFRQATTWFKIEVPDTGLVNLIYGPLLQVILITSYLNIDAEMRANQIDGY